MTSTAEPFPPQYVAMLSRDGHGNPPAFAHALQNVFRGIDFRGKRVLEIGSGRGLLAMYIGMRGAAEVLSMEPELVGATSGVIAEQRARLETLGLQNVVVVPADFNTWDPGAARFDVIVSRASINHLHESAHHAEHHEPTWNGYVGVARRIHGMLSPNGQFVATDACRYAFFTGLRRLGVRRPWNRKRSGVDWRHHQNPGTWIKIFRHAGFSQVTVHYPVPYRLKAAASVIDNRVANFFLTGGFILNARR
jgi:SAM-dependent methyltransferase